MPSLQTASPGSPLAAPQCAFACNICGKHVEAPRDRVLAREAVSCSECGSNRRFRTIVYGLSLGLFGRALPMTEFPVDPALRGVGLSDALVYAEPLANHFSYVNTFYDTSPQLDITRPDPLAFRDLDFLIASDVFEHVALPVDVAFRNVRSMLKRRGTFVFSVPYGLEDTTEHFPRLHDFRLEKAGDDFLLVNRTADGTVERHGNLVFHGGPGSTLEMRVFGLRHLYRLFRDNGFSEPRLLDEQVPEFGIEHDGEVCSMCMVAKAV